MSLWYLSGNTRSVLHKISVDLPKKHGRGGQSALRFARLRLEKRHNYLRKVAELATQFYITNDRPNVSGIILAGLADFKTDLNQSDIFYQRLKAVIIKIVDVSYGGENGFNQAIELSQEVLSSVKFIQEKKLLSQYYEEISQDTGKYVFGVKETMAVLLMGSIETLIVWENLEISRYLLKNPTTGVESISYLNPEQEKEQSHLIEKETGIVLEVLDCRPLSEWLAEFYRKYGAKLEFVTNKSQEGAQFCKGFGGIGGILRYRMDLSVLDEEEDDGVYEDDLFI